MYVQRDMNMYATQPVKEKRAMIMTATAIISTSTLCQTTTTTTHTRSSNSPAAKGEHPLFSSGALTHSLFCYVFRKVYFAIAMMVVLFEYLKYRNPWG
ncbi:unnamed protein product [Ceratitis capitata]|uniref:(Mediterranean fruit fly) hypothetical protein n=1 Tax=Ceratitis capitata TaxID=7213 RepID=A0A811UUW1_CERCA|nr:unnamed protein product [Ceratitis capitata]